MFSEIVQAIAKRLQAQQLLLATAESCTGGQVAAALTDLAGSSAWFERGFVTYSNAAKNELLGVSVDSLANHGAVSEVVAREMAAGALQHSRAHVAIATTGIAGPSGGTVDKPVGTVCFAWAIHAGTLVSSTEYFVGNRAEIRAAATKFVLTRLLDYL